MCTQMCARLSQTRPETTRIDILFERKHNKTHWNMVQEEQGVILKVNKQKRRVAEALSLLSSQQRGDVGPARERAVWGFLTQVPLLVFHQRCSWTSCLHCESALMYNTSRYLFGCLLGDSLCLQMLPIHSWKQIRLRPALIGAQGYSTWNLAQHSLSRAQSGCVSQE